ncbi:hypothetical protein EDD30_0966 [Couchioplanes caeruleus]|uniref:Uncharacterized protein n=1 Tax=Couchioplanes caeruleus TaxID=56438 RepID=A0A3N1GD84_9ACTN|nr:hypothetical protein EDD30_0966 [Couchioplanes caeruleus]
MIVVLCTLLLVVLIAVAVVAAWPKIRRAVHDAASEPAGPAIASAPARSPQTLEGVLTLQLVAGEITGTQYRHAMSTLAARDAERHPLDAPPDVTPPEAA